MLMISDIERPLVLKWGTSSTTDEFGIVEAKIEGYASQIASIKEKYRNIIAIASGSVAVGKTVWRDIYGDRPLPGKQTLAMLGTAPAHMVWQRALAKHGLPAGQLLATHHQVDDRSAESILGTAIHDAMANDVVPVGNENDAMSLEEMAKLSYGGENDGLASHIAVRFSASGLIIYTDTEGLMQKNDLSKLIPRIDFDPGADLYARTQAGWVEGESEVNANNAVSKVDACLNASLHGIPAYIAKAGASIEDILAKKTGTYFEESAWAG